MVTIDRPEAPWGLISEAYTSQAVYATNPALDQFERPPPRHEKRIAAVLTRGPRLAVRHAVRSLETEESMTQGPRVYVSLPRVASTSAPHVPRGSLIPWTWRTGEGAGGWLALTLPTCAGTWGRRLVCKPFVFSSPSWCRRRRFWSDAPAPL